jgi:uncharacterized protein (DUF302 family)
MELTFKKTVNGSVEEVIEELTEFLKKEGFGILTRIDLHSKFNEKLNKDIPATVILGACNPQLAYEAFKLNTDVASLLPCNAVVREISKNLISVELARPSALMRILGEDALMEKALEADFKLERVLCDFKAADIPKPFPESGGITYQI